MNGTRLEWPAAMLLKLACRLMPPERREWAEAMKAELPYLPREAALSWAAGCVVAALKQRFALMNTGSFRVHRWVLLVEILGCFGPATLAWWIITFGHGGVAYWNSDVIGKYIPGMALADQYQVWLHAGRAITGLIAPIGLFLGLRHVIRNRALDNRALGYALVAAPVLQTAADIVGAIRFGADPLPPGIFVLLVLLPIVGITHLMYLAKPVVPQPTDAGLAAG